MDTSIQSREESYLAKIAGENVEVPENPESRSEYWLKKIAENGTSGGGGSSITVDSKMSGTSTNPTQNKVVKEYVDTSVLPAAERAKIHTHSNKNILDGIEVALTSQYMSQIMTGVAKAHEHGNKSILDAIQVPLTSQMSNTWNAAANNVTSLQNRVSALEAATTSIAITGDDLTIGNALEAPLMEMSIYGSIKRDLDIVDESGNVTGQKDPVSDYVDFNGRHDANGANPITITKNAGGASSDISRGVLLYSTLYGMSIPTDANSSWQSKTNYTYGGHNYVADEAVVTESDAYVIKRIQYHEFTSSSGWRNETSTIFGGPGKFIYGTSMNGWNLDGVCISSIPMISYSDYQNDNGYGLAYWGGMLYLRVEGVTTVNELDTWIKAHTFKVAYPLNNPITRAAFDSRDAGYVRNLIDFGLSGNYTTNTIASYNKGADNVFSVKYAAAPVSKWAAQPTKPTYTATEVNAVSALRPNSTYGYIRKDLISITNGAWSSIEYSFEHDGYITFDPDNSYDGELFSGTAYTTRRDDIRIDGISIGNIGYSRISVSADDSLSIMKSFSSVPRTIYVHKGQKITALNLQKESGKDVAGYGLTMYIWDTEPGGSKGRV